MTAATDLDDGAAASKRQAVILADAMFGTCSENKCYGLQPLSKEVPQILCPLNNVPILDYIMEFLASNHVEQVVLVTAAKDERVRLALEQKVSRERVGGEVDLMLRSPDPVGAMRLLSNLNLVDTVFPVATCFSSMQGAPNFEREAVRPIFDRCLNLLSTTHDHLFDCKVSPPCWWLLKVRLCFGRKYSQ